VGNGSYPGNNGARVSSNGGVGDAVVGKVLVSDARGADIEVFESCMNSCKPIGVSTILECQFPSFCPRSLGSDETVHFLYD
jgi:hypothetical protein